MIFENYSIFQVLVQIEVEYLEILVDIEALNEYINLNRRRHGEAKQIPLLVWIKNNLLALAT